MRPASWPKPSRLPLRPQLPEGLCARHPQPDLWTSDDRQDRELAATVCTWCPAREPCLEWSLTLPTADNAIYAGNSAQGRQRLRKQAQEAAAAPPAAAEMPPAA